MMSKKMMLAGALLALLYGNPLLAGGNPDAEDAIATSALERGAELFDDCSTCHGDYAEGGEDYGAPKLSGQLDWYLIRQLQNFRAGSRGTHKDDEYGPIMQPMAVELTDQDIEDVVAYIMTLDASYDPDED